MAFKGNGERRTRLWLVPCQWRRGVSQIDRVPFGLSDRNREIPDDGDNVVDHELSRRVRTPCDVGRSELEDEETDSKP